MQALVTGGSGFIGSEVIRQLLSKGIRVRALLRKTSPLYNLQGVEYEPAIGDLGDQESLDRAVAGVDYVFHIAGSITARTREEFFRHNAEGTGKLARACAKVSPGLKRFVYVSSVSASGPGASMSPRLEDEPSKPVSAYGASKLGGEIELERAASGLYPFTVIRPPIVYGPRDRGVYQFIKIVNYGAAPVFPGRTETGEKYYSVVHVEDLVRGIMLAGLAQGQGQKEVFFLCGDGVFAWTDLMNAIAEGLGKKRPLRLALPEAAWTGIAAIYTAMGKITGKQFPLTLEKLNDMRPDYWICSNEKAKAVLGFQPEWNLKEGMAHTVSWYREHGWV